MSAGELCAKIIYEELKGLNIFVVNLTKFFVIKGILYMGFIRFRCENIENKAQTYEILNSLSLLPFIVVKVEYLIGAFKIADTFYTT